MPTKTAGLIAAALACLLPASSPAQPTPPPQQTTSVTEVVARYAVARGGLERWRAVDALELTGTYTAFSEEGPFTLVRKRPDLYRFDADIQGKDVTLAWDGGAAWWIQPVFGFDWAVRPPQTDSLVISRESGFEPALFGFREKGHTVELVGPGDVDGQPTLQLKVTFKDGRVETWHLDPKTFLEVAIESKTYDFSQGPAEMDQRAYFSDFRTVDGLVLPHRIEREYGARHTVLAVEKVRVNLAVEAAAFRLPLSAGMEALRPLAGEWDVAIESRQGPRGPFETVTTTATITPLFEGAALEERLTASGIQVVRTWTYDRFAGLFRLSHLDGFTAHLNVFEGTLENGKLTAGNEKTGTFWTVEGRTFRERQTVSDIGTDGFKVEWERSTDGGATWWVAEKYTYTRRKA